MSTVGRAEVTEPAPTPIRPIAAPGHSAHPRLPVPLSSFVGRDREIEAVTALLRRDAVRLVTLTGPGGVGKTRLAIKVAEEVAADFAGGVDFVPLAPVRDPGLVLATIAQALGVSEAADQPLTERVIDALHPRRLLLVLDNLEHVLDAAPTVADLLAGCPLLTILATSRAHLRISGEQDYTVQPLTLPATESRSASELANAEAVALFVERAQAVLPDFALNETTATVVADICRRLDGLPLAIELAAPRLRMFPPPALLARLEPRLPLLTGGSRDQPARLQTMRDAVAWSYDLLVPAEQLLFRRLSVFAGGFTLAAAEAVAKESAALDHLAALVDHSLVRQSATVSDEPRFDMLETVREFALEQLRARGEEDTLRHHHAAWCLALIEEAAGNLHFNRNIVHWMERVDAELDNLRVALAWFDKTGRHADVLRLLSPMPAYWGIRPHLTEVRRWLNVGLRAGPDLPAHLRGAALHTLVCVEAVLGDSQAAIAHAEESLAVAKTIDDPAELGCAWFNAGLAAEHSGDAERAALAYATSASYYRQAERPEDVVRALIELGDVRLQMGDIASAAPELDEALTMARRLGDTYGTAMALGKRAHAARVQGDVRLAARLFEESIAAAREIGALRIELGGLAGLAGVALVRRQPVHAARLLGAVEAERVARGVGQIAHLGHAEHIEQETRARLGDRAFTAAWDGGRTLSFDQAMADALELVATDASTMPRDQPDALSGLTHREREVLRLIAEGRTDREIASHLRISPRTVNTHTASIYAKLGVGSRAEAAVDAVRRGLL